MFVSDAEAYKTEDKMQTSRRRTGEQLVVFASFSIIGNWIVKQFFQFFTL
jgi:hypothetical protein